MRALFRFTLLIMLALVLSGFSADGIYEKNGYRYITAATLKSLLDEDATAVTLLDIQVEDEFQRHAIPGAIATYAYPVKSDSDKAKIDAVLDQLGGTQPIVVVCPRGGGGARRGFDHLSAQGIDAGRLLILENGQAQWPYPEYTVSQ